MNEVKVLWGRYFAEYIREHKNDGKDLFQLTNEAINYTMDKLGWDGKMPERQV